MPSLVAKGSGCLRPITALSPRARAAAVILHPHPTASRRDVYTQQHTHSLSMCTITTHALFFLFLFLLLYFFARTCFPFVQTQKQAYTLLVFFISLLQSGWIHGVHAQPLPHHASPSLGVRGTGNGARECGGSTGLLEEGGVVVGKGVGG